jgi:hypothetical protein
VRYFVIGQDGNKYGPADMATLQAWSSQGRVHPDSWLEEESTGRRLLAREVLGAAQPTPPPSGFTQPPSASPYPRPSTGSDSAQTMFIVGWICAVVSICFCPIGFGAAAIILGVLAKQKGHPNAMALIVCAIVFMIVGIVLGVVMLANNPQLQRMFG